MKTSQSFPFYASDFIMGTMLMTGEEVGAYIRLLCWQWEQGMVPSDPSKLARITGVNPKRLCPVLEKFDEDSEGNLKNFRMEEVRADRENYIEMQRAKGLKGGRPKGKRPKPGDSRNKPVGFIRLSETGGFEKAEKSLPSPLPLPLPNTPIPPEGDCLELDCENESAPESPRQPKTPHGQRIHAMFHRGPKASWSEKELKTLAKLEPFDDADFSLVENHYIHSGDLFIRKDVQTFLNNFQGEVDRVRGKLRQPKSQANRYGNLNPQRGVC